jgi:hypothetical protein
MARPAKMADCHPDRKHAAHGMCKPCYSASLPAREVKTHGYNGYTLGCRCDICRKAKREYARERRAAAKQAADARGKERAAGTFRHGTRFGYEERGCRCAECVEARRAMQRTFSAAKRKRQAVAS